MAAQQQDNLSPPQKQLIKFPRLWRQLRWNLIVLFVVVAVLPLTAVVAILLERSRTSAEHQVVNQLESVVTLKNNQISQWLAESQSLLRLLQTEVGGQTTLVSFMASDQLDPEAINASLAEAVAAQSTFEELFLYDLNGQIVASSNERQVGKVVARRTYFAESLRGDTSYPPHYEEGRETLTMVITHPIMPNGTGRGVLAGRLNMDTLGQIMTERTGLGETGETYLVSLESRYLLTPSRHGDVYPLTRAYRSQGIDLALMGESGAGTYDNYQSPPVSVIGVYRWVPDLQAAMLAEVEESEALVSFVLVRNVGVATAVTAAMLAGLIGYFSAGRIARPVTELTQVAASLRSGDLTPRAYISRLDEFALLATTFNSMADELRGTLTALEESQQRFSRLAEASFEGLAFTEEGHIIDANDQLARMLGFTTAGDLIGKSPLELVAPVSQQFVQEKIAIGTREAYEHIAIRQDGSTFPVEVRGRNFLFEGKMLRVTAIRDITERKQAQAALEESEKRLQAIMDHTPGLIHLKDLNGRYLMVNKYYLEATGLSRDAVLGHTADDLYPEMAGAITANDRQILTEKRPIQFESSDTFQGVLRTFLVTKFPLFDEQGNIFAICGISTDITEHKKAEAALEESEKRLQAIMDHTPSLIQVKDLDGRYLMVNKQFIEAAGMPRHAILGMTPYDIYPDMADSVIGNDRRVLEEGRPIQFESSDGFGGDQRTFLVTKFPLYDEQGSVFAICGISTDITERKQAEIALQESEKRLQAIMDNSPSSIYVKGLDGRYLMVNQQYLEANNFNREAVLGKTVNQLYPEAIARSIMAEDRRVLDEGRPIQFEYVNEMIEGQRTFLATKFPLFDEQGNIFATCGISTEITERIQAEAALAESEKRLQAIMDNSPSLIYMKDLDGHYLMVNQKYLENTGLTREAILGKTPSEIFTETFAQVVIADDRKVLEAGQPIQSEHVGGPTDSSQTYLATKFPLYDERGNIFAICGITTDITERKQAEIALQESEKRLQAIMDHTPSLIYVKDLDGRFTMINQKALETYKLTRDEVLGKTVLDLYPEPVANVLASDDRQVLETRRPIQSEFSTEIEGMQRTFLVTKFPLYDEQGNIFATSGVATDITDRIQAEEQIRQMNVTLEQRVEERTRELSTAYEDLKSAKEAAEAANQAKSRFLASMSHELRTPLNGILGYAQILQRDDTLASQHDNAVQIIRQSGEHLLMLINDILDLSKIEAGRVEIQPEEFHLPIFLGAIVDMVQVRAAQANIGFYFHPADELPTAVLGDEKRLRQILLNLLSNAVKFTPKGRITFTVEPHDGQIRFKVADTGIGMSPDEIEQLFQPFTQVGSSPVIEGTGLGLSISQRLAEAMGSIIHVQSTPDQGSIFWLDVALEPVQPKGMTLIPQVEVVGYQSQVSEVEERPLKILIVDDKADNRSLIYNLLAPIGFEIVLANDGQEALAEIQTIQPDLVLMDIIMPNMDGLTATSHIRQMPDLVKTPIIATSASAFANDRQRSLEVGCDDFIAKPINMSELLAKLEKYLALTWIYAQPTAVHGDALPNEVNEAQSASSLPPGEARALFEMARRGRIREIKQRLAELEALDGVDRPFIEKLGQLAERYRTKEIEDLLKPLVQEV